MDRKLTQEIIALLESMRDEEQRVQLMRFFRTGKGEYGEGDEFLGIKVPVTRAVVKEVRLEEISLDDIDQLLKSKWHEVRLCGLLILVRMAEKAPALDDIVQFYLNHADCANNWDLVDLTTPRIVGRWLMTDTGISAEEKLQTMDALAMSGHLWKQRIAMVSTWWTSKEGDPSFALRYAEILLNHSHDLMHKAVGWMLREMGKSRPSTPAFSGRSGLDLLREFLRMHAHEMPRTTLRYAIEKMSEEERKQWMQVPTEKKRSQSKKQITAFAGRSLRQLLDLILAHDELQDEAVIYLLKERLYQPLQQVFLSYENNLCDPLEDLLDDFFLYLREGRQGTDLEPYRMLQSIREKNAFENWLLSTWRNFLTGKVRKLNNTGLWQTTGSAGQNEWKIYIVSRLIAYADQEFRPRVRFIFLRSMLSLLNKQKALSDKEMAEALCMSEISYRVTNYRLKANLRTWRDCLMRKEILPLDEQHQQMAKTIDENFANLYDTLMLSYQQALEALEQKEAVEKLRMQYRADRGSAMHDGSMLPIRGMGIDAFWSRLMKEL